VPLADDDFLVALPC